jgi:hypothetical protein
MTQTDATNRNAMANAQLQPRQELVAHQTGELAPLSLPELANKLAGAVSNMGADDIYADVVVTQTEESRITKFSFRAYKHRKQS